MNFENLRQEAMQAWEAFNRPARPRVLIGAATCGRAAGATKVRAAIEAELAARSIAADVYETGCIGMCYAEPLVEIRLPDGRHVMYGDVTEESAVELVRDFIAGGDPRPELALATLGDVAVDGVPALTELPMMRGQVRIVLKNAGICDPTNVQHYIARGGYAGLAKALGMAPQEVIDEVKAAGLRGRGGAGFPTGLKWDLARKSPGDEKYVICNADEGDPGAFMDRSVLESDPHAVLEGLTIAAYAIGAHTGYVYVRAEYPLAVERLRLAIGQMERLGLLGDSVMGTGFGFSIKIKMGAGAFVCGEETALMASIEGRRGMPRPRPPFPAVSGLHGKPTNINNVETLACVPQIVERGAAWFASYGTEKSRGTKTFALAGKIQRTGLIEVPMGISLRDIIYTVGGGIPEGRRFKAVQTGGPSGGCIPASLLDMPVDYEKLVQAGTIMGSGGMVVMDEETCMVDIARYFVEFTKNESCGKCTPCRMGSQQMLAILERIVAGEGRPGDVELLLSVGQTVKNGSLCGLGQSVPNPVMTTIRYFRDEYEAHINRYCPANVCKAISPAPCHRTCPIGMDVPSYIALCGWGRFEEALDVMYEDNPFPSVCGRICPRPCEPNCTRGESDQPLAIRALKRFIVDHETEEHLPPPAVHEVTRPERVAVVGGGPCGLTAAHYLASLGYAVTVFEAQQQAGGMLRQAVPDFRLGREVVKEEVDRVTAGLELHRGAVLGRDFTLQELREDYAAVLLALGAPASIPLRLQQAAGSRDTIDAVRFLTSAKRGRAASPGRRVAVIGFGHLALDAARTAVRLGAAEVTLLYPRTKQDLAAEELDAALQEGVRFEFGCLPLEVLVERGRTVGVRCQRTSPGARDTTGRQRPRPTAKELTVACDAVIAAVGHKPDPAALEGTAIRRGILDNALVDPRTMETDVPGVFAAGDLVACGTTVIDAIAAGQRAAAAIHRHLNDLPADHRFKLPRPRRRVEPYDVEDELADFKRPAEPLLDAKARQRSFDEAVQTYSTDIAVKEAKRCLRCDLG